ncbi:MAG TPA: ParB/RepB/Spo0J family partition protein [Tepidisphaeraceae bacterium]|nr:ParB/RepB/Spo0J family partition protein [Tepidisphaeraceae bacterium]
MSKQESSPRRLGRGLSSLINVSDAPVERTVADSQPAASPSGSLPRAAGDSGGAAPMFRAEQSSVSPGAVLELPIDSIVPNPHQPRRRMNDASLKELADSIKGTGLIQPVLVRRTAEGISQLIAGERRWRASKLAGLKTILAIVRDVDVFTQAQMALVENIQREDLNPIDRAAGYRTLVQELGLTQAELAGRLGEDRSTIANFMRLLELQTQVQDMVRDGQLSLTHAKLLVGVTDMKEQFRLGHLCATQGLNARNLERLINGSPRRPLNREKVVAANSMHLADLEKRVASELGMRVQVKAKPKSKGKGSLVIHYANLDQFDDLMTRLGVKLDE